MKKTVCILLPLAACVLLLYLFLPGFLKSNSAFVQDFSVSADGTQLTLTLESASSAGFFRKAAVHTQAAGGSI